MPPMALKLFKVQNKSHLNKKSQSLAKSQQIFWIHHIWKEQNATMPMAPTLINEESEKMFEFEQLQSKGSRNCDPNAW